MKTPGEILLENELVITMVNVHHYVPHKDHGNFRQVIGALMQINPKATYNTDCSGCMLEIGRMAQIHLDAYKATINKTSFHTFPVHEKDKGSIGEGKEEAPKEVRKTRGRPKRSQ